MRAVDVIIKKRDGNELSVSDIEWFIKEYLSGGISDYQVSALLMAVFLNGFSSGETAALTKSMIASGRSLDLSYISAKKVDKHSTGGVGDKISLILAPLVASCGVTVPMISGRGLGHTGGTLDKLQSIEGYKIYLNDDEIRSNLKNCGFVMLGQSDDIVPADKKIYALRDVTGTVESIPLITASILSKKIAEGADSLVMDIKCGSGAFMKDLESAKNLALSIRDTGRKLGIEVASVITKMDEPLGRSVGNFIEVKEVADILKNGYADYLLSDEMEIVFKLSEKMLLLGGVANNEDEARKMALSSLNDGKAYEYFLKNIESQGGNIKSIEYPLKYRYTGDIKASKEGYIKTLDAYKIGVASVVIGCGRNRVEDSIDNQAGIGIFRKVGDRTNKGDTILEIYCNDAESIEEAVKYCENAIEICDKPVVKSKSVLMEIL
ncbi:MAG TPA: thymidine phosphorylase [Spirochaetota bacterium]|jgi:pyrimidine-nucleoside phosphorylase|nr:MAG: Pyrimidine-nucleoside phosphorylase [Spirochaetes bacterium ADurb.Bin133]HNZ27861.1 thymidine phosphorylase [Spirochaetota bacterium]HPY88842.1 thymidine phosphorylase [Spirochaetota bacterium]HQB61749.1 thymidine phosphorylase [Spirochaetota bacterium]